jgi:hypothetical protein
MSERRSTLNARLNCNNNSKIAPPVKPLNQNAALKQMPNLPCPAPAGKKDKKKKSFLCCW